MKLSVIIVNYNVEYFLEQCLHSVYKAIQNLECEVFVVDNTSVDGSVEMVRQKFPWVELIANTENVGFSKANNQAIRVSKGEHVLLLNPDTVVEEDTFEKVVAFMDEHPDAGGLGCKMIDGKGKFLPESKRGLPTPSVAFYKIFGLSALFPRNKQFSKYHLGYLDENETHEIEILAGAFMLMRKETLDKVGLLDEDFFMYGEDIDLSYRITLGGYKNYYYPHTRIIHYKGESTKKSSVNYVFVFYNAMVIFAKKHFSQKNARIFSFLINAAIWFRASVAILNRFIKSATLPVIDMLLISGGAFAITIGYGKFAEIDYPPTLISWALPIYAVIWALATFLTGGYDKPIKLLKVAKGVILGTGIILACYALLPKNMQFSRFIILFGGLWAFMVYGFSRLLLRGMKVEGYNLGKEISKRFLIIGELEEAERVNHLLSQTIGTPNCIGTVNPKVDEKPEGFIGHLGQLQEIVEIYKVDELIFCAKNLSSQQIIALMSVLDSNRLDFKIAPPESLYIIGSNSIETSGDLYVLDINSIAKPQNRRQKRIFDVFTAFALLVTFPFTFLFVRKRFGFFSNIFKVLVGKKSWIGYGKLNEVTRFRLPQIKPGVLSPLNGLHQPNQSQETADKLNIVYAKDYQVSNDLNMLFKGFKHLGE